MLVTSSSSSVVYQNGKNTDAVQVQQMAINLGPSHVLSVAIKLNPTASSKEKMFVEAVFAIHKVGATPTIVVKAQIKNASTFKKLMDDLQQLKTANTSDPIKFASVIKKYVKSNNNVPKAKAIKSKPVQPKKPSAKASKKPKKVKKSST